MRGTKAGRDWLWLVVVALAALVLWATPETAAGERLIARVGEPFEVNGEVFPAGSLGLKQVQTLSPVATLLEIRVNGDSRGLLLVRSDGDRVVSDRDELGFVRAKDGHLVLESVAIAGQRVGTAYTYRADAGQWFATVATERPVEVASNR